MVKKILHLEGLVILLFALYFYSLLNGNWLLFILLLFTPDISMIGYMRTKKIGASVYNAVHNYVLAGVIVFIGLVSKSDLVISLGIILIAHIGLDRFLGFGLKYPMHFRETHLQRVK